MGILTKVKVFFFVSHLISFGQLRSLCSGLFHKSTPWSKMLAFYLTGDRTFYTHSFLSSLSPCINMKNVFSLSIFQSQSIHFYVRLSFSFISSVFIVLFPLLHCYYYALLFSNCLMCFVFTNIIITIITALTPASMTHIWTSRFKCKSACHSGGLSLYPKTEHPLQ